MPWVAAAGAVVGAAISSNGAQSAADTAAGATQASIDEQRRQYDQTRADMAPWRDAGSQALGQLQTDINKPVTAADVMSDPGYQFGMQQGQQALDRKIAAMGGRVSGAALKQAARFGTDYASSGYNAAYQRSQDRLNRLAALAGIGQTATNASAQAGQASTNAITALRMDNANTQGAAGMAQSNIWGNAGNQLAALYGRYRTQPAWGSTVSGGTATLAPTSDPYYSGLGNGLGDFGP